MANDLSDTAGFPVPGGSGGGKGPLFIGGAVLLLVAALIPFPHTARAPYQLAPYAVTPVAFDRAGTLATVPVAAGQWVTKGTVLATWDTAEAKQTAAALEAKLAAAQRPSKPTAAQLKKLPKAKAKLGKARASAAALKKKVDAMKAKSRGKSTPALAKLEQSLAHAEDATKAAQQEVDALSGQPALSPAELAALNTQLVQARAQLAAPPLTAPEDGTVLDLAAKPGQRVAAGAPFARLEDTRRLKALIEVPKDEQLAAGTPVQLEASAPVKASVARVNGSTAEVDLDNASGALKPGAHGTATFAGESRSLLGRL